MIFSSPVFLWALPILLIPILIHLFLFRRVKKIHFSNIRWITKVQDETKSQNRLKHLLILATRLMLLIFLILAFLGPSEEGSGSNTSKSYVYIDNSLSLSTNLGEGTGLDATLSKVQRFVESKPMGHEFVVLTNDFSSFSNRLRSKNETLEYLSEIDYSLKSRALGQVENRLMEYKDNDMDFHIFSDFQKSTVASIKEIAWEEINGQVFLHPLVLPKESNVFVDTAYLYNPFFSLGTMNTITFDIKNIGERERKEVTFRLLSGNRLIGSQIHEIPNHRSKEVSFEIDPRDLKDEKLSLSIEDYPVTFDNTYHISLPKFKKVKVGIVSQNRNSYLPDIFGNSSLFEIYSYLPERIDFSELGQLNLLVIEGVDQIPQWLNSFRQPLDIVVIPSSSTVNHQSFSNYFNHRIENAIDSSLRSMQFYNLDHPFYQGVLEEVPKDVSLPKVRNSIQYRPTTNTLLANELGDPYLTLFNASKNDLYLFSSPLTRDFTDFPEHSLFLPIMYKIAQESLAEIKLMAYRFDDNLVEIRNQILKPDELIKLSGGDFESTPSIYQSKENLVIEIPPEGIKSDFYYLIQGVDTLSTIAFNTPKAESDLTPFSYSELVEFSSPYENVSVSGQEHLLDELIASSDVSQNAYWKYALILALIFVLLEMVLLRYSRNTGK